MDIFRSSAPIYLERGWEPMPVPFGRKKTPPEYYTGKKGALHEIADSQMEIWYTNNADDNVCLRMGMVEVWVSEEERDFMEVIGIDIDHGYKGKTGGDSIHRLERDYGPLPPTYSTTSRGPGLSRILYYLVPLSEPGTWKSVLISGVEILHRGARYAMAPPSVIVEADGSQRKYLWWELGPWDSPDLAPRVTGAGPPRACDIPELPEAWISAIVAHKGIVGTGGRAGAKTVAAGPIAEAGRPEHDSLSLLELDPEELMCKRVARETHRMVERVNESDSSHPVLVESHWELLCLAGEGHRGVARARGLLEEAFMEHVISVGKRPDGEGSVRGEMDASWVEGLGKLWEEVDRLDRELASEDERCSCPDGEIPGSFWKGTGLDGTGWGITRSPWEYERTDEGCVEFMADLAGVGEMGRVRHITGYKNGEGWIVWDGVMWRRDDGKQCVNLLWRYVSLLYQMSATDFIDKIRGESEDEKEIGAAIRAWMAVVKRVGMQAGRSSGLKLLADDIRVEISLGELDTSVNIFGLADGTMMEGIDNE